MSFSQMTEDQQNEYLAGLAEIVRSRLVPGLSQFIVMVVEESGTSIKEVHSVTDAKNPIDVNAVAQVAKRLQQRRSFSDIMEEAGIRFGEDDASHDHGPDCDCHCNSVPDHVPEKIVQFVMELAQDLPPKTLPPSMIMPVGQTMILLSRISEQLQEVIALRKQKEGQHGQAK